jgi:transcriptional regulator with XRE-family HTH domain
LFFEKGTQQWRESLARAYCLRHTLRGAELMKPIRGTTEKCFAHLVKTISSGEDFYEKREQLAAALGVVVQTVYTWMSGTHAPIGETLIRLRFYLELLGYDVDELRSLPPAVRGVARLVAFEVASLQEVAAFVGYEPGDGPTTLLKIFRGVRNTSDEKMRLFASLATERARALEEKRQTTPNILTPGAPVNTDVLQGTAALRKDLVEVFAKMVSAMLPLAEEILSDGFTAADRELVRALADGDGVSRLSFALTRLSGESVRNALNAAPAKGKEERKS